MNWSPFARTWAWCKRIYFRHEGAIWLVITGASIGIAVECLSCLGNPTNAGICISCFFENLAGSLGLHDNARMQYIRPELMGFFLGGTFAALLFGEYKVVGGSSPILRFFGGFLMIVGSGVFIGCPIRLVARLAGGDGSALIGIPGLVFGVWLGWLFLKQGFDLGESSPQPKAKGLVLPLLAVALTVAAFVQPDFLHFSSFGPGAHHASFKKALAIGLLIGFGAQRSRYCLTGAIGQSIVTRTLLPLAPPVLTLLFAFGTSLYKDYFHPSFVDQPGAHLAYGWSFLGMALVGLLSALMSGCPFRQITLASQGSTDGIATIFGMLAGAAAVQSWGLASTSMGPTPNGIVFLLAGLALTLLAVIAVRIRET